MRRMWSDLLSWIVGGLMSSSTHAASFCLPICAASLRFQHTYMCFNSLWLLFDLPHLLLGHLQNIFKAPCLLHASGRWKKGKENSCTNNRCVLWSQAATSIFERMVCSQPLTQVNKVCWEKGGKCFLCSNCDTSAHLHVLVGWWLLRFEWLLPFFYFIFFFKYFGDDTVMPVLCPSHRDNVTAERACLCVHVCTHSQKVSHTGLIRLDLLRRQKSARSLPEFPHCT